MSGADLPGVFDPNSIPPVMGGGNALPPSDKGGHLVVITESEMRQTSNGTGTMLALTLTIQDGPHRGVEGDWNLNLGHAKATVVRIAQQELSCICHAVGHVGALQNIGVLHNKPFRVVVALQSGEGAEKGYTNVTKVLRADGSKLTDKPGSGGGAAPPPAPAPGPAAPPAGPGPAPAGFPTQVPPQPPQQQAPPPQEQQPPAQPPQQNWQQPPQQTQQPPQQPAATPPWGQPG
jgi:hypothetical protein